MVAGRKVLLLESDRAAAFPLASALRRNGWAVISAADAAQAQQLARQQKPDAVVLNAQLAGGGGLATLKRLRSSLQTTLIPVICIVDRSSRERAELAAAGAQEMIDPPGDADAINAALARYLGRGDTNIQVPPAVLGSSSREAALRSSGLLDDTEDGLYDDLTRLAATLLRVPVALVSIVDAGQQTFKGQTGLQEPFASTRRTPLSHSFCQWVVGGSEEVVISDARQDFVLKTNLAVRDLGVTAYAGVPFGSGTAETLGSFCAIDSNPRNWSESDLATLRNLSLVLQAHVVTRMKNQDRETKEAAVTNGILGATRALLGNPTSGTAERLELAHIVEEQSHRLVQLLAG